MCYPVRLSGGCRKPYTDLHFLGAGQFTILDPAIVTEADLGVNFFLEEEDLGASRAECCCRLLQELNPDVTGNAITEVRQYPPGMENTILGS